jgi:hypothetical protein
MLETSCVLAPFVDTPCSRVVGAGYNTRTMQLQWTGGPGAGFPECMPWDALCAWLKHGGCCCQLSPLGSPRLSRAPRCGSCAPCSIWPNLRHTNGRTHAVVALLERLIESIADGDCPQDRAAAQATFEEFVA